MHGWSAGWGEPSSGPTHSCTGATASVAAADGEGAVTVGDGHVFVVPGDVRNLAADAWLLPSDRTAHVRYGWFDGRADLEQWVRHFAARNGMQGRRAAVLPGPWDGVPQPIMIAVPDAGSEAQPRSSRRWSRR
jgi:hypothetical protein